MAGPQHVQVSIDQGHVSRQVGSVQLLHPLQLWAKGSLRYNAPYQRRSHMGPS